MQIHVSPLFERTELLLRSQKVNELFPTFVSVFTAPGQLISLNNKRLGVMFFSIGL